MYEPYENMVAIRRWKPGVLRFCAGLAVGAAAAYAYLRGAVPPSEEQWWVVGGAALCTASAVWYLGLTLRALRDLRALARASRGNVPREGAGAVFTGTIESEERVRTPFTATEAVAYRYQVTQWKQSPVSEGGASVTTHYSGSASVPSVLVTPAGRFPLLCWPRIPYEGPQPVRDEALRNFREYAAVTTFERTPFDDTLLESRAHRFDRKHWDGEPDWDKAEMAEAILRPGSEVTLFAWFVNGGIGVHPDATENVRLYLGSVRRAGSDLWVQARMGLGGIAFFLFLATLIVGGYHYYVLRYCEPGGGC